MKLLQVDLFFVYIASNIDFNESRVRKSPSMVGVLQISGKNFAAAAKRNRFQTTLGLFKVQHNYCRDM
jgi:hypothetical protein